MPFPRVFTFQASPPCSIRMMCGPLLRLDMRSDCMAGFTTPVTWPRPMSELTHRAADVLHKLAGKPPVGLRTASWDFSDATLQIMRKWACSTIPR